MFRISKEQEMKQMETNKSVTSNHVTSGISQAETRFDRTQTSGSFNDAIQPVEEGFK